MKKALLLLIAGIMLYPAPLFAKNVRKKLSLDVGGETIINIPGLNGISNAGDIVEDVILNDGESVMLRGVAWGETQITLWDKTGNKWFYDVQVSMPKFVKELQLFLQEIEGVDVNFLGRNIIVEGQLLRESDVPKLKGILNNFPEVKNMVTMETPPVSDVLIEAIRAELYNYGNLKFSFLGEGLMYEGRVFNDAAAAKARAAGPFYFNSAYPALSVAPPEVTLQLSFMEFVPPESASKKTGFLDFVKASRASKYENRILIYTFFDTRTHDQAIEKVMSSGQARPLSKASLECQSGQKVSWQDPGQGARFFVECQPRVFNPYWIDCRLNLGIEKDGKNLFWQTQRIVLNRGQGAAFVGLLDSLRRSVPSGKKGSLEGLTVLSDFFPEAKPGAECVLVLTPNWKIKE